MYKLEHGNLPLFSNPMKFRIESSILIYFLVDNNSFLSSIINVELVTENDIIDHDNKANPIIASSDSYLKTFDSHQFFVIDYKFDVIKYENDVRYLFNNFKNFTAVGKSEISVSSFN